MNAKLFQKRVRKILEDNKKNKITRIMQLPNPTAIGNESEKKSRLWYKEGINADQLCKYKPAPPVSQVEDKYVDEPHVVRLRKVKLSF